MRDRVEEWVRDLNGEGTVNEDEKLNEVADVRRGFREIDERTEPPKCWSHLLSRLFFFLSSFAAKKQFIFKVNKKYYYKRKMRVYDFLNMYNDFWNMYNIKLN